MLIVEVSWMHVICVIFSTFISLRHSKFFNCKVLSLVRLIVALDIVYEFVHYRLYIMYSRVLWNADI